MRVCAHLPTNPISVTTALIAEVTSAHAALVQRAATCEAARRPLTLRAFRAVPLRSLAPKFDENFRPGKDADPDRDRAEARSLKKKVKQEKRGAIRELRKDAVFLALEARKQQEIAAAAKEKKRKATITWLNQQAADFNPSSAMKGHAGKERK